MNMYGLHTLSCIKEGFIWKPPKEVLFKHLFSFESAKCAIKIDSLDRHMAAKERWFVNLSTFFHLKTRWVARHPVSLSLIFIGELFWAFSCVKVSQNQNCMPKIEVAWPKVAWPKSKLQCQNLKCIAKI